MTLVWRGPQPTVCHHQHTESTSQTVQEKVPSQTPAAVTSPHLITSVSPQECQVSRAESRVWTSSESQDS